MEKYMIALIMRMEISAKSRKIFKWYAEDFGNSDPERLHFMAPHLYEDEDRRFLERQAKDIRIK